MECQAETGNERGSTVLTKEEVKQFLADLRNISPKIYSTISKGEAEGLIEAYLYKLKPFAYEEVSYAVSENYVPQYANPHDMRRLLDGLVETCNYNRLPEEEQERLRREAIENYKNVCKSKENICERKLNINDLPF